MALINENPVIHNVPKNFGTFEWDEMQSVFLEPRSDDHYSETSPISPQEVYNLIAEIKDPEHPYTLAQLAVISPEDIELEPLYFPDADNIPKKEIIMVNIKVTPTIPHCSMATLIGLCLKVRLETCLPSRYKVYVKIKEGSHNNEESVNKQLNDKERVAAACENPRLFSVLCQMMEDCDK